MLVELKDGRFRFGALHRLKEEDSMKEVLAIELSDNRVLHLNIQHRTEKTTVLPLVQQLLTSSAEQGKAVTIEDLKNAIEHVALTCDIELVYLNQLNANEAVEFYILLEDTEGIFSVENIARYDSRIVLTGERRSISLEVQNKYGDTPLNDEFKDKTFHSSGLDLVTSLLLMKRGSSLTPIHLGNFQKVLADWGIEVKYMSGVVL